MILSPSRLLMICVLAFAPVPALAHKIVASVFASGTMIEGEVGMSDGSMAVQAKVIVSTPEGRVLGETVTDDEGMFTFAPTEPVNHVFRADLGAGHVATATMTADEVGAILGKAVATPAPVAPSGAVVPQAGVSPPDTEAIAAMLRDELRPLRQELAAYKEKNDLQTVLGGIGYIFGLFGVGFYIAARRQLVRG